MVLTLIILLLIGSVIFDQLMLNLRGENARKVQNGMTDGVCMEADRWVVIHFVMYFFIGFFFGKDPRTFMVVLLFSIAWEYYEMRVTWLRGCVDDLLWNFAGYFTGVALSRFIRKR